MIYSFVLGTASLKIAPCFKDLHQTQQNPTKINKIAQLRKKSLNILLDNNIP